MRVLLSKDFWSVVHPQVEQMRAAQKLMVLDLMQEFPDVALGPIFAAIERAGWVVVPRGAIVGVPVTDAALAAVLPTVPSAGPTVDSRP